jgi:glycosyltransferase involved in cell wall biosynthesis
MLWSSREYILHTWWRWNWAHRAANQFSRLICVSEAVQRECEKKGYQCPLSVIRNGLADLPVQGRAPDAKLRIGFLGAGQPQRKGFSIVEQWIRQLQGNVIWKLYGGASEKTLALIGRLQEVAPVEYRGFQKRDAIFSEIDVLVHASNLFDPLPTVLIEAARAGLPCIASSNGGAAEIVEAGGSGFIFDPKDPADGLEKLRRLLDPQLRAAMGQAAREIFDKKFRVERMVREYEEFFEQLAAGKK